MMESGKRGRPRNYYSYGYPKSNLPSKETRQFQYSVPRSFKYDQSRQSSANGPRTSRNADLEHNYRQSLPRKEIERGSLNRLRKSENDRFRGSSNIRTPYIEMSNRAPREYHQQRPKSASGFIDSAGKSRDCGARRQSHARKPPPWEKSVVKYNPLHFDGLDDRYKMRDFEHLNRLERNEAWSSIFAESNIKENSPFYDKVMTSTRIGYKRDKRNSRRQAETESHLPRRAEPELLTSSVDSFHDDSRTELDFKRRAYLSSSYSDTSSASFGETPSISFKISSPRLQRRNADATMIQRDIHGSKRASSYRAQSPNRPGPARRIKRSQTCYGKPPIPIQRLKTKNVSLSESCLSDPRIRERIHCCRHAAPVNRRPASYCQSCSRRRPRCGASNSRICSRKRATRNMPSRQRDSQDAYFFDRRVFNPRSRPLPVQKTVKSNLKRNVVSFFKYFLKASKSSKDSRKRAIMPHPASYNKPLVPLKEGKLKQQNYWNKLMPYIVYLRKKMGQTSFNQSNRVDKKTILKMIMNKQVPSQEGAIHQKVVQERVYQPAVYKQHLSASPAIPQARRGAQPLKSLVDHLGTGHCKIFLGSIIENNRKINEIIKTVIMNCRRSQIAARYRSNLLLRLFKFENKNGLLMRKIYINYYNSTINRIVNLNDTQLVPYVARHFGNQDDSFDRKKQVDEGGSFSYLEFKKQQPDETTRELVPSSSKRTPRNREQRGLDNSFNFFFNRSDRKPSHVAHNTMIRKRTRRDSLRKLIDLKKANFKLPDDSFGEKSFAGRATRMSLIKRKLSKKRLIKFMRKQKRRMNDLDVEKIRKTIKKCKNRLSKLNRPFKNQIKYLRLGFDQHTSKDPFVKMKELLDRKASDRAEIDKKLPNFNSSSIIFNLTYYYEMYSSLREMLLQNYWRKHRKNKPQKAAPFGHSLSKVSLDDEIKNQAKLNELINSMNLESENSLDEWSKLKLKKSKSEKVPRGNRLSPECFNSRANCRSQSDMFDENFKLKSRQENVEDRQVKRNADGNKMKSGIRSWAKESAINNGRIISNMLLAKKTPVIRTPERTGFTESLRKKSSDRDIKNDAFLADTVGTVAVEANENDTSSFYDYLKYHNGARDASEANRNGKKPDHHHHQPTMFLFKGFGNHNFTNIHDLTKITPAFALNKSKNNILQSPGFLNDNGFNVYSIYNEDSTLDNNILLNGQRTDTSNTTKCSNSTVGIFVNSLSYILKKNTGKSKSKKSAKTKRGEIKSSSSSFITSSISIEINDATQNPEQCSEYVSQASTKQLDNKKFPLKSRSISAPSDQKPKAKRVFESGSNSHDDSITFINDNLLLFFEKCCNSSGFVQNRFKEFKRDLSALKEKRPSKKVHFRRYRYSASNEKSTCQLNENGSKALVTSPKAMASPKNDLSSAKMAAIFGRDKKRQMEAEANEITGWTPDRNNQAKILRKSSLELTFYDFEVIMNAIRLTQKFFTDYQLNNSMTERQFGLDEIRAGLHDWALWRKKLNESFISNWKIPTDMNPNMTIMKPSTLKNCFNQAFICQTNSEGILEMEPRVSNFVGALELRNNMSQMDPGTYILIGIPRARLVFNQTNLASPVENTEYNYIIEPKIRNDFHFEPKEILLQATPNFMPEYNEDQSGINQDRYDSNIDPIEIDSILHNELFAREPAKTTYLNIQSEFHATTAKNQGNFINQRDNFESLQVNISKDNSNVKADLKYRKNHVMNISRSDESLLSPKASHLRADETSKANDLPGFNILCRNNSLNERDNIFEHNHDKSSLKSKNMDTFMKSKDADNKSNEANNKKLNYLKNVLNQTKPMPKQQFEEKPKDFGTSLGQVRIITGINVKEKVKAFENAAESANNTVSNSNSMIVSSLAPMNKANSSLSTTPSSNKAFGKVNPLNSVSNSTNNSQTLNMEPRSVFHGAAKSSAETQEKENQAKKGTYFYKNNNLAKNSQNVANLKISKFATNKAKILSKQQQKLDEVDLDTTLEGAQGNRNSVSASAGLTSDSLSNSNVELNSAVDFMSRDSGSSLHYCTQKRETRIRSVDSPRVNSYRYGNIENNCNYGLETSKHLNEFKSNPDLSLNNMKQSNPGLMSSTMSLSSQFMSPPLPGHFSNDHRNNKFNEADLKRDINLNSLLSDSSHMDERSTAIIGTSNLYHHNQDPNTSNIMMMMMPNDGGNIFENFIGANIRCETSIEANEKNTSKTTHAKKTLFSKSSKKHDAGKDSQGRSDKTSILKAADGDIIFANTTSMMHPANDETRRNNRTMKNLHQLARPMSTSSESSVSPSRRGSPAKYASASYSTASSLSPRETKRKPKKRNPIAGSIAAAVASTKNLSSLSSLVSKSKTHEPKHKEEAKSGKTKPKSKSPVKETQLMVMARPTDRKTRNPTASEDSDPKELKAKLIKNERYNYLSPLKNMLKSKNKTALVETLATPKKPGGEASNHPAKDHKHADTRKVKHDAKTSNRKTSSHDKAAHERKKGTLSRTKYSKKIYSSKLVPKSSQMPRTMSHLKRKSSKLAESKSKTSQDTSSSNRHQTTYLSSSGMLRSSKQRPKSRLKTTNNLCKQSISKAQHPGTGQSKALKPDDPRARKIVAAVGGIEKKPSNAHSHQKHLWDIDKKSKLKHKKSTVKKIGQKKPKISEKPADKNGLLAPKTRDRTSRQKSRGAEKPFGAPNFKLLNDSREDLLLMTSPEKDDIIDLSSSSSSSFCSYTDKKTKSRNEPPARPRRPSKSRVNDLSRSSNTSPNSAEIKLKLNFTDNQPDRKRNQEKRAENGVSPRRFKSPTSNENDVNKKHERSQSKGGAESRERRPSQTRSHDISLDSNGRPIDHHTKKKIISDAVAKSRTLKPPSIPAPPPVKSLSPDPKAERSIPNVPTKKSNDPSSKQVNLNSTFPLPPPSRPPPPPPLCQTLSSEPKFMAPPPSLPPPPPPVGAAFNQVEYSIHETNIFSFKTERHCEPTARAPSRGTDVKHKKNHHSADVSPRRRNPLETKSKPGNEKPKSKLESLCDLGGKKVSNKHHDADRNATDLTSIKQRRSISEDHSLSNKALENSKHRSNDANDPSHRKKASPVKTAATASNNTSFSTDAREAGRSQDARKGKSTSQSQLNSISTELRFIDSKKKISIQKHLDEKKTRNFIKSLENLDEQLNQGSNLSRDSYDTDSIENVQVFGLAKNSGESKRHAENERHYRLDQVIPTIIKHSQNAAYQAPKWVEEKSRHGVAGEHRSRNKQQHHFDDDEYSDFDAWEVKRQDSIEDARVRSKNHSAHRNHDPSFGYKSSHNNRDAEPSQSRSMMTRNAENQRSYLSVDSMNRESRTALDSSLACKTKPKTSKEILQEISRLTNGTGSTSARVKHSTGGNLSMQY